MTWLTDPLSVDFMVRALVGGGLAAVLCAVVGTWVLVRGMAFLGEALSHGMLPGVAIASLTGFPVVLGAAVSAAVMVLGVGALRRRARLSYDTSIGLLFVGMLALGVIIVSSSRSFATDVAEHFDRMIQAYSEPAVEDLSADELRQRIRLRILSEHSGVASDPTDLDYARPFAPGLVLGLCVDYPTMVSTLSGPTLLRLPLGTDELFALGQLNTDDEPVDEHAEIAPGVFLVEGESLFVASKAVNLP
ncbi:metal ABC transporter permease, partial [Curtobacterium sp. B18]|uniref:metal ABC transporter permease n=1 Tax=Curtobacterium sp. B18 TaxID=95614 RepID=UPI0021C5ACB4